MAVFFTADHHFGDGRRLGIDRRPFASVAEMDAAMAARWNEAVGPEDEVWHLGDLTRWRDAARVGGLLAGLNGRKRLLVGNNDAPSTREAPGWESVAAYAEIEVDGVGLVLCHYPFRTWNGMGRGRLNLHGHSHGRLGPTPRQFDVGVDVFGFRPVTLREIIGSRGRRARPGGVPSRTASPGASRLR